METKIEQKISDDLQSSATLSSFEKLDHETCSTGSVIVVGRPVLILDVKGKRENALKAVLKTSDSSEEAIF